MKEKLWCEKCREYTRHESVDKRPLGDYKCMKCGRVESYITISCHDPEMIKSSYKIYTHCGGLKPEDYIKRFDI